MEPLAGQPAAACSSARVADVNRQILRFPPPKSPSAETVSMDF